MGSNPAACGGLEPCSVSATLRQCFALEHGEREAFYREGVIAVIERLFFGPPLVGTGQDADGS